jgi:hypothetical protein
LIKLIKLIKLITQYWTNNIIYTINEEGMNPVEDDYLSSSEEIISSDDSEIE